VRLLRALAGLARCVRGAPREARLALRDRRTLAALRGRTDLRINVGSSSSALEGWINVDLLRDPEGRCLRLDASQAWPFGEGSAEAVNSEHFIEHLSEDEAQAYLREAFRVLGPGGVIRTSTPDLAGIARSLLERSERDLAVHRSHGYIAATHGELVNNYVYGWGHRRLYDEETLTLMLERAGFVEPRSYSYGESDHEALRGIDRHDPSGLEYFILCLEAVKPA
jgi:predicted SAM-dependent methyltransferase